MENQTSPTNINLKDVDWNNLQPKDFQVISNKITENNKLIKASKERKKRITVENQTVSIKGVCFNIPSNVALRLKHMKSEKSKEKLINEIFAKYKPIEVI